MTGKAVSTQPPDPKLLLFSVFLGMLRAITPAAIRSSLGGLLLGVTPNVPVSLLTLGAGSPPLRALWAGAALAFLFCFAGTAAVTLLAGTFAGDDPTRLYFVEDRANLLNYSVVVPAFVGLGCSFALLVRQAWCDLASHESARLPRLPMGAAILVVLLAGSTLTVNYIRECMSPAIYSMNGWYFDRVLVDGSRVLGIAGAYYIITNFALLVVCCSVGMCFFPYAAVAAEVARGIRGWDLNAKATFETVQASLSGFTHAYITLKLFAAALMVNLVTWSWSQPHASLNFHLMRLILSTVGVFVVSFPRYYVELEWFQFKVRAAAARGEPIPSQSDDLRDWRIRAVAYLLDLFFGVTFVISVWKLA